jgi:hypothetical protein
VPDITIPADVLEAREQAGLRAPAIGIEMAERLLAEARPLVQGTVLAVPETNTAGLSRLLSAVA